jgi:hypothetical protein
VRSIFEISSSSDRGRIFVTEIPAALTRISTLVCAVD